MGANTPDPFRSDPRWIEPQSLLPPAPLDLVICKTMNWQPPSDAYPVWIGWHDDGSMYVADAGVLLHLPAPAAAIFTDLSARRCAAARERLGDDYRVNEPRHAGAGGDDGRD